MTSDEETDERRSIKRLIPLLIALVCVAALVLAIGWVFSSNDSKPAPIVLTNGIGDAAVTTPGNSLGTTIASATTKLGASSAPATVSKAPGSPAGLVPTTSAATTSAPTITSTRATTSTTSVPTTQAVATTAATSTTPTAPVSTAPAADPTATTTAAAPPATATPAPGSLSYPTNVDGTPQPIVLVYDTDTITLAGMVPSQAAKDRLEALAIANSQTPGTMVDQMTINPDVPIGIGVRVIELNSTRFPSGSAKIQLAQGAEITRVATAMNALPNTTVVVVGHADQIGSNAANLVISSQRARAVVDFLSSIGIDPTRLSSRAAGDADLLTLDTDAAALALNRRTEFIFYGLLVV